MSEELNPCPACGHTNLEIIECEENPPASYVLCDYCGLQTGPTNEFSPDVVTEWNALPRRLKWTREYPTKPGWYWYRRIYDKQTFDCHVKIWQDNYGNLKVESHQFDPTAESLWAGPIPEPMEAEQ